MDLMISGGWSTFNGQPCGRRQFRNAYLTVFDGEMVTRVMRIILPQNASLSIESLSFINALLTWSFINGLDLTGRGAGLDISKKNNLITGRISLNRLILFNNQAQFGGDLSVNGTARIDLVNMLVF